MKGRWIGLISGVFPPLLLGLGAALGVPPAVLVFTIFLPSVLLVLALPLTFGIDLLTWCVLFLVVALAWSVWGWLGY